MKKIEDSKKTDGEKLETIPIPSPIKATLIPSLIRAALVLLILVLPALGDAPDQDWEKAFGGTRDERGLALLETKDSGLLVVGTTSSKGAGGVDLWLIKTDSEGEMEWDKTFGGAASDEGWAILEAADNGYLVAGVTESEGSGGKDLWLIKTDSDGDEKWKKTFGGAGDDWGVAVLETTDGGYAAAGITTSQGSGGSDGWIVKTDTDGNEEWDVAIGGSKNDSISSILETTDGYIVVGVTESYGAGGKDVWLVKTDADGERVWEKTFGKDGDERGNHVLDIDGGYVIVGVTESEGSGKRDLWVLKTDSDGEKVWGKTFGGIGDDGGWSALEGDDGFIIAGYTESQGRGKQDLWLLKVDTDGEKVWEKTFGGTGFDLGKSIISTKGGGWAVTGWTRSIGSGGEDLWLLKTEKEE